MDKKTYQEPNGQVLPGQLSFEELMREDIEEVQNEPQSD